MQPAPSDCEASPRRPHVVVVDDDPQIGLLLSRYLQSQQMEVTTAADGSELRRVLHRRRADIVLLDLGLPGEDGLDVMRWLRADWAGPVIIVSGRGDTIERVVGLEMGADDYVTKPFELREVLARIRSVLRRASRGPLTDGGDCTFGFEGFRVDAAARCVVAADGAEVALTSGEFNLLLALVERSHRVISRDELMSAMHGREAGPFDRAIDVQIGRLRRKLGDDAASPRLIKSVRGAGYLFAASVTRY